MSSKHVLIMDEVDGMAGNEDRGGIQVLELVSHDLIGFGVYGKVKNKECLENDCVPDGNLTSWNIYLL